MKMNDSLFYANHAHIVKHEGGTWATVKAALPDGAVEQHLNGSGVRYGVPFVRPVENTAMAGMIDIDDHGGTVGWERVSAVAAQVLGEADKFGLVGHPFRSGGGHGINIWFVWASPQRAEAVKWTLELVVSYCNLSVGAGGVAAAAGELEVFPKQGEVAAEGVGNCAALPRTPLCPWSWVDIDEIEWVVSQPVSAPVRQSANAVVPVVTVDQLTELLAYVPVVGLGYDEWWQRVMMIHAAGGSVELAREWSRRDPAYADDDGLTDAKWRSIKSSGVTVLSLMSIATKHGWSGFGAAVDAFPVAVNESTGELLIDYTRVPGKGRYAGKVEATLDQVCRCIESDPEYPWRVSFDQFMGAEIVEHRYTRERLLDHHAVEMRRWFDRSGWEPVGAEMMRSAIDGASKRQQTNIAKDWLNGLVWDGVDRYEEMLAAMDVIPSPYTLAVARYQWTSHAARVLEAGYQADAIIVLVSSKQGTGKTQYIRAIAPMIGDHDTYQNLSIDDLLHSDKSARALLGCLVANLDEMRDFGKREAAEIKAALSRTKESYIPKYKEGRREFGRSCLIYATNNEVEFLDDPTGNRRYHIYPVGNINLEWVRANAEQLWAQGRDDFRMNGQAWQRALELAEPAQQIYKMSDVWTDVIVQYLSTALTDNIKTGDIMTHALQIPLAQQDRRAEMRVGKIMRELGMVKKVVRFADGLKKVWRKEG